MIGRCAAPSPDLGLVKGVLATVDCNIREGVQGGYMAFFGPGSTLGAVVTILLTLYVALIGYRLMTGRTDLRVGDLPSIAIKIGAVVLLTTSWASWQGLVFDVLFEGPAELAATLTAGMAGGPGGAPTDVFAHLQRTFDQLTGAASALAFTSDEPGQGPNAAGLGVGAGGLVISPGPGADPESLRGLVPVIQMRSALQGGPAFGSTALWISAVTLLVSTLGVLILSKLMLGLLLAIGPIFVGLLLFDATKGLFEGWLRTALGFALVPLATVVFMAALLASLQPSLAGLEAARAAGRYDVQPVLTILVITLTFTAVFASVLGLCTRLAAGFRLPDRAARPEAIAASPAPAFVERAVEAAPSRAERIAATVAPSPPPATTDRRDARLAAAVLSSADARAGTAVDRRTEVTAARIDIAHADASTRLGAVGRRRANPVRRPARVAAGPTR